MKTHYDICSNIKFQRKVPRGYGAVYSSARVVFVDRFEIRWGIMTETTELAMGK